MIEKMTKYTFILLSRENEGFLEKISQLGAVDIRRSRKEIDEVGLATLAEIDSLKSRIELVKGRKFSSDENYSALLSALSETKSALYEREVWGEYDEAVFEELTKSGVIFNFYRVPQKKYDENWGGTVISVSDGIVRFVTVGASDIAIPYEPCKVPQGSISDLKKEVSDLESKLKAVEEGILAEDIEAYRRKMEELKHNFEIKLAEKSSEKAADEVLTIYTGFVPSEKDEEMTKELEALGVYYSANAAVLEDNPPIKLRNNGFVRQFEVLTGMYGMPVYNEFDPTVFLSCFFLLFFAMCMGDAGYGILLILIGLMLKGKEGGLAKLWSLIVTLGAGTLIVGLVMGGFFGIDLSQQEWVPSGMRKLMLTGNIEVGGGSYSIQMAISLLIGIVHICLALIMKAVWSVRQSGFKESLSAIGWTLLIVGGVIGLAAGLSGIVSEEAMKLLLIGIAAVSAMGIFIFNKWGRNPLINIGSGLWDTYSMASGLMGDVLSYIRLYALGLSGGMLGSTFNQIAQMVKGSDPTWQWIPFVVIIVIGHALNLAMSCLGAFVHPLRLNFVEFFKNSSYQGRGTEYRPLTK